MVINDNGCVSRRSVFVQPRDEIGIFIHLPTVPDNDGYRQVNFAQLTNGVGVPSLEDIIMPGEWFVEELDSDHIIKWCKIGAKEFEDIGRVSPVKLIKEERRRFGCPSMRVVVLLAHTSM